MKFETPLSRKLGLKYPIVAAPMFIVSNKEMIVAAAEAGILGTMPSLNAWTTAELRENLAWIRERTDKPFGINMTIGMTDAERIEGDFAACVEYKVPVLITSYGNPTQITKRAHEAGMMVFHDVIHLTHAKKAESAGVDGIIAVGAGAGGHGGTISPYVLIPHLKEQVTPPIIAAGCISSGKHVAASLALGAELCYIGTRFIASEECGAVQEYKNMIVDASVDDIVYTNQVSGTHANFLKATVPKADAPNSVEDAARKWVDIWSAGQGVGLIHEVKSMEAIVDDIVREYHDTVAGLPR